MSRTNVLQPTALAAVLALYVGARIWGLTATCLWFDEIFSVHAAEHSWNDIWQFVALDLIHPPLFYALLKLWIGIGGEHVLWLRVFPVAVSIIAIVPFFLLCKELKYDRWKTTFAFLLIASNGPLIKYSQEVRMYSLLMCISLFSLWLFTRYVNGGKGIAALIFVNVLLVYTHYFGWFVVAGECAYLLFFQRSKWRPMLIQAGVLSVTFVPWLWAVVKSAASGADVNQNIGWMNRPGITDVLSLMLGLVEPFYYKAISIEPASIYYVSVPLLVIAFATITVWFLNIPHSADDPHFRLLLVFVLAPAISAFCLSWVLPQSIWGMRHLIVIFVPFALLLASSIFETFKLRPFLVCGVILLIGCALAFHLARPKPEAIWCGFEPLTREMEPARSVPVVVFEDLAAYHLWFAFRDERTENRPSVIKVSGFPGVFEDKAYFLPRGFNDVQVMREDSPLPDEMLVIYRGQAQEVSKQPLNELSRRGYVILDRRTIDFGYQQLYGLHLKTLRTR